VAEPLLRREGSLSLTKGLLIIAAAAIIDLLSKSPRNVRSDDDAGFASPESVNEPLRVHLTRAKEVGRGRQAASPTEIPWKGWSDIFRRTIRQASEDRILAIAGGVVFYGLLALFPAITALVSFYALFAKPDSIGDHLSFLQSVMPADAYSVVQDQVSRVIAKGQAGLTFGFLVGLALALWSANAGMKAIMDALNIVYEESEKRGLVKLNLVSLAFTVAGIFCDTHRGGGGHCRSAGLVMARPRRHGRVDLEARPLADTHGRNALRPFGSLSIWAESTSSTVEMDQFGCGVGHSRLVRRIGDPLILFGQLRQLQRDLRVTRRRHRNR
jgi:hypothetical protein